MQWQQSDLLVGIDQQFINRLTVISSELIHKKGVVLFRQGDPATHFFILQNGRVRLSMDEDRNAVYTVNNGGEVFGWSSLTGRSHYSATAHCMAPTVLTIFQRDQIERILAEDPVNGLVFYKNLAQTLGRCLIRTRHQLVDHLYVDDKVAFSIDQVQSVLTFV